MKQDEFLLQDEEVIQIFNEESEGENSVEAVRIIRDQATNLGKGIAYVLFKDAKFAKMALAKDGTLLRKRPIRVTHVKSAASGKNFFDKAKPGKQSSLARVNIGALGKSRKLF